MLLNIDKSVEQDYEPSEEWFLNTDLGLTIEVVSFVLTLSQTTNLSTADP